MKLLLFLILSHALSQKDSKKRELKETRLLREKDRELQIVLKAMTPSEQLAYVQSFFLQNGRPAKVDMMTFRNMIESGHKKAVRKLFLSGQLSIFNPYRIT